MPITEIHYDQVIVLFKIVIESLSFHLHLRSYQDKKYAFKRLKVNSELIIKIVGDPFE